MDISSGSHSMDMDFPLTPSMEVGTSDANKRRSSSRSIKRRKFDDELVEYSFSSKEIEPIVKKPHHRSRTLSQSNYFDGPSSSFGVPSPIDKRRIIPKSSSSRKSKKSKLPSNASTKDLGRWKPTDDLALITAVIQSNDLQQVHRGIKFSCKFTFQEIQQRWYSLLYETTISKIALNAMRTLHRDVICNVESKTLYSKEEQQLLATIKSSPQPPLSVFEELLSKNCLVFHRARTPKSLMSHWVLMKQYYLLDDQTVPGTHGNERSNITFSELEESVNDGDLHGARDETLEEELFLADRLDKKEIRTLEGEVNRWQVLVDAVSGIAPQEFDNQTLAVLKGRLVRYLMRSRQITIGRTTKDISVDVDLQLEGPASKVSRQQGTIRLRNNGEFFIMNEGKRAIYVDGRPILTGTKYRLNDNAVLEITGLRFIFLINMDLISIIKLEASNMLN